MSRYELLLFLHIASAIVWLGGAMVLQLFKPTGDDAWFWMLAAAILLAGAALALQGYRRPRGGPAAHLA